MMPSVSYLFLAFLQGTDCLFVCTVVKYKVSAREVLDCDQPVTDRYATVTGGCSTFHHLPIAIGLQDYVMNMSEQNKIFFILDQMPRLKSCSGFPKVYSDS